MAKSLRAKLKKLNFEGKITDKELNELLTKLEGHDKEITTRYFDAYQLTEKLMREAITDRADLLRLLTYFPTADVTEIKHGYWLTEIERNGETIYLCSECDEIWVLNDGTPKDNNMNYCPNCGAKMDMEV